MKVMKKLLIGAVCVLTFAVSAYAANEGEDNDQNDGLNHAIVNMDNNERELDTWDIERNLQNQMLQAIEQGNLDVVRNLYDQGRELMNRDPDASAIPYNWYPSWINYLNIARENGNEDAAYELINFLLNNNANVGNIVDYYDFSSGRNVMDDFVLNPSSPFNRFSHNTQQKILRSAFIEILNAATTVQCSRTSINRHQRGCKALKKILRHCDLERVRISCYNDTIGYTLLDEEGNPKSTAFISGGGTKHAYNIISNHLRENHGDVQDDNCCCTIC